MQTWEYTTLVLRLVQGQGKVPGYFTRAISVRGIAEDSERDLNQLGALGWELVNVLQFEYGAEGGPSYATAILKRPLPATDA